LTFNVLISTLDIVVAVREKAAQVRANEEKNNSKAVFGARVMFMLDAIDDLKGDMIDPPD